MHQIVTISLLLLAAVSAAAAEPSSHSCSLAESFPAAQGKTVKVERGAFLTKSAKHEGLKVQFQEGRRELNWTQITTEKSKLLDGSLKISASPVMTLNRDGRAGYGGSLNVRIREALEFNHSSQVGGMEQHITTARVAPRSWMSLKMVRFVSGDAEPVTRIGPEVKLGKKTNVSYGHAINGATNQLLVTSNLRF